MTDLLVKNAKIAKSGNDNLVIYNFGIPAYETEINGVKLITCPGAGTCASGCYATMGAYGWNTVQNAYRNRLIATLDDSFVGLMVQAINTKKRSADRNFKDLAIRIHDSGDFYTKAYLNKWLTIMKEFPSVKFYAYSKMIPWLKDKQLPNNFTTIFSYGGKFDSFIDREKDRHSSVFQDLESLVSKGYSDASKDDSVAFTSDSNKIGLIYHGYKSKEWTTD